MSVIMGGEIGLCVLLVVVVHLLMFAVSRTAAGALVVTAPLTHEPWFARATYDYMFSFLRRTRRWRRFDRSMSRLFRVRA